MESSERVARWDRWRVSGTGTTISRLIEGLHAHLPAGWRRLTGGDAPPSEAVVRPGSIWYVLDAATAPGRLSLSLEQSPETELRGGQVCFTRRPVPPAEASAGWDHVMRFVDGVVAAAKAAGAEVCDPSPEEVFLSGLFIDVRSRLVAFAKAARKSLPLDRDEAELWRAFAIAAFRFETPVDPGDLTAWLVADGWPRESATELSARFSDHWLLLSQYAEEVSAA